MYWVFWRDPGVHVPVRSPSTLNALWQQLPKDLVGGLESGISVHCLHAAALTVPDARLPKHIFMDDSGCLGQLQAVAPDDDAALLKCLNQNHNSLCIA